MPVSLVCRSELAEVQANARLGRPFAALVDAVAVALAAVFQTGFHPPGKRGPLVVMGAEQLWTETGESVGVAVTDKTVRAPEQLRAELARVRHQGYALDNQEYAAGGLCYAVPIFDHAEQVAAALNVAVLTLHYSLRQLVDDLGPRLQATAQVISRSLGAPVA